jgi:diguanylate cyclase (GGDEF)-like protein
VRIGTYARRFSVPRLIRGVAAADIPEVRLFSGAKPAHASAATLVDARERAELEALHETTLRLIERLDVEDVLNAIVERAAALVGTRHGYLYLLEPDGELRVHVGTGIFRNQVGYRLRVGDGLAGRVARAGEPLAVQDYSVWAGGQRDLQKLGFRAVAGVPLLAAGTVTGVLGLAHLAPNRTFGSSEIALLTRFGRLASLALDNARLYAAAQRELDQRRRTEEELLDTVARLRRSEQALHHAHEETIRRLGHAAEFRDSQAGSHIERMSRYCTLLGRRLGLDDERCELLRVASPLHDIGKIAIPDEILFKPGPLTPEERAVIERHAEIGYRLLAGSQSELLELAATIAWTHHERYDGGGYPRRLAGEAIPLAGRIASVADVFDALTSDRVYRPAVPLEQALDLMRQGRGTHFDPAVLDALLDATPDVAAIAGPDDVAVDPPDPFPAGKPARRPFEPGEAPVRAGQAAALDADRLRAACSAAEAALIEGGSGRHAIEQSFAALAEGLEEILLVSAYVHDHDRLWLIAQRGYREVRDGFSLDQGVLARAIRTGRVQFLPDVTADPEFIEATNGIVSEVAVPFGDRASGGGLNVETMGATLPPEAEALFGPLALLLEARIEEMREDLGVDVASLARLCVHASSLRGVGAIAEFATRTLGRLLGLESAQLDIRREGAPFRLASFWRREKSGFEPVAPAALERLALIEEASGGSTYRLLDQHQTGLEHADASAPWLVWFPLRVAGAEIGAIVGRLSSALDLDHERVEAATLFAQHTGALIDVALTLRREQRAAVTDALTGLLNRRGFDERLHEEFDRVAHTDAPLTLVLVDCDGLKAINDTGGHELGDRVLQSIARCLRAHKRLEDVAARIGGDEFAVILPGADSENGARVAERLRGEVRELPIGVLAPVAATFGVASFPADGRTAAELLRAADRALYLAKQAGGDRTLVLSGDAA